MDAAPEWGPEAAVPAGILPPGVTRVVDEPGDGVPSLVHPGWRRRFEWLAQGTTTRGPGSSDFDLRLFGRPAPPEVFGRWWTLVREAQCTVAVHSRQVHGTRILRHGGAPESGPPGKAGGPPDQQGQSVSGLLIAPDGDGHLTSTPGWLLTVSVADCVPVFAVEPHSRSIALLHAGWRGAASGILEAGLDALVAASGRGPQDVSVHLGPAICGRCYEVGPEVHGALGLPVPERPTPVDLRAALAARALRSGVGEVSVSGRCTRCGDAELFSHRAGHDGRQVGFLGLRAVARESSPG